jgi:hypothetical protein
MKIVIAALASLLWLSACGGSVSDVTSGMSGAPSGGADDTSVGGASNGGSVSGLAAGAGGIAALGTAGLSGVAGNLSSGASGNGSSGSGAGGSSGAGTYACTTNPCFRSAGDSHCAADQIYWACVNGQGPVPQGWQASCELLPSSVLAMCCPASFGPACR